MTSLRPLLRKNKRLFWALGAAVLVVAGALTFRNSQTAFYHVPEDPNETAWVDSMFNTLTDDERIGQLIMIRAHSNLDSTHEQMVENLIRNHKVGGICFFQGTPEHQAELTNRFQAASGSLPLLVSMDAEWGLGMRLVGSTVAYPKQLMLGALRDNALIYDMGREVARQCRRLGVHLNFAPVADVNNNPDNPVINDRSFGEDRHNVAAKCYQYAMGMQNGGVLACMKHFPGHGDTNTDSHFDLPVIRQSKERLDSLELYPFRALSQYGAGSVMVAHLHVPAFDNRPNRPTTLSRSTVYDLLRKRMHFEGLIFTDAMEMQGVAKFFAPGQADVEALRAGNDVVLLPADAEATVTAVKQALADGSLDREQFNASVRRMLRVKYRLRLTFPQRVNLTNLRQDLNSPSAQLLKRKLVKASLTLVRDERRLAGFPELENSSIASLALGDTNRTVFQTTCGFYAPIRHFNTPRHIDPATSRRLLDSLRGHNVILVSLHNMRSKAVDQFGLTQSELDLIDSLRQITTVALTVFGNPYSLKYFDKVPVLFEAYNDEPLTQELAAQALFGAHDIEGVLPITASRRARFGAGLTVRPPQPRMAFTLPEAVGLNSDTLAGIDQLALQLIKDGAAPGCQILIAKDNQIVWNKAYGRYTYDSLSPLVTVENMYDLASVTKVAATTLSVMHLVGQGKMDVNQPMATYVPELAATDKKDLTVLEMMTHHAGLTPWIPFYQQTLASNSQPSPKIYKTIPDPGFRIPVAEGLFMSDAWVDSVWQRIFHSELRSDKSYKYSDFGLYLSMRAVQNVSGKPLDVYVRETFYQPMGLNATFTPWRFGLSDRCPPTENDDYFRHRIIQGYVHDMGAAMLGGVSGHAGLFGNALDLAKLFQMLLNGGSYGGRTYLQPEVVKQFTTRYATSTRRGIGFDMKELNPSEKLNMSTLAGPNTFGHTGFTGICVWADPDQKLIFIFLSNRTYPTMNNNKLINGNYRPRLQDIVYKSFQPAGG